MEKRKITIELEGVYLKMAVEVAEQIWGRSIEELVEDVLKDWVISSYQTSGDHPLAGEDPEYH